MLLDLAYWRENNVTAQAEDYVRTHHCRFWDQDALNAVLSGTWKELDPRWNVYHFHEVSDPGWGAMSGTQSQLWWSYLQSEARILHYVTGLKPWSADYPAGVNYSRYLNHAIR